MINKAILDAIADVLKKERKLTDAAVAVLRNESVEEAEVLEQRMNTQLSEQRIALNVAVVQLNDQLEKMGVDLTAGDDAIRILFETHDKRVTETLAEIEESSVELQVSAIELRTLLDNAHKEFMKMISDIPAGEKGDRGETGEKGADGRDGRDGSDGINGKDGRDGVNGDAGAVGPQGDRGIDGAAGRDGADGRDGMAGRDGVDGERGTDGLDRDLVAPFYPVPNDSLERNSLAYSQGGMYQAIRKTLGCPVTDPGSYRLVLNGLSEIVTEVDDERRVTLVKAIFSDGSCETVEVPHGTNGKDGQKGEIGLEGGRGRKGVKGDQGVGVEDILYQADNLIITLTNGVSRAFPLPKPTAPVIEKMHGVHETAPIDPPVDYLWVSPTGKSQIWTGKKWVKLI